VTQVSSQQFNRDVSAAKRAALDGPVFITSRGRATHVLLSLADYRQSTGQGSLRQALMADDDIDFEPACLDLRLEEPELQ
jgi:prevent-host-death family protein